ncbi:unnamed protein product (macronuclear) [Paramecium tetraurelia]|uniref:Methyltransferase type 11 domain-containing protein n=1 Tax=Paramecium tetraurelia TaxID=5888 RepID=A0CJB2_PARTE|nr:uncharacterized protein GSPATT00000590001 [Paramecium tetraurelia]CAK70879.1 unnamed protein product [Paramecium tetraurelia]|eukprot:XP_001438276.1 hypothetical protein (macronuclear) [Paramecium tetraurelia strain d4-2]
MNIEYLQKLWDSFSHKYTAAQKNPSVFCFTLLNMLRIEDSDSIIDAGCGGGHLHQYIVEKKNPYARFVAFDFSNQMVKITAARMYKYLTQQQKGGIDQLTQEEIDNVNLNSEIFNQINYSVQQANIQELIQFQDNTFETYLSNLVFHLIPNPQQAMAEAYRILRPGGRLGITVWGSKNNSKALTIYQEALIRSGILEQPQGPSKFLESTQPVIEMAQLQGFTNIYCWTQQGPFDNFGLEDLAKFSNPEVLELLKNAPLEKVQQFENIVSEILNEEKLKYQPLFLECILLVATKPK